MLVGRASAHDAGTYAILLLGLCCRPRPPQHNLTAELLPKEQNASDPFTQRITMTSLQPRRFGWAQRKVLFRQHLKGRAVALHFDRVLSRGKLGELLQREA